MGITDSYVAYCFDEAVTLFGMECESAVETARNSKSKLTAEQRNARGENALRKMIGIPQKFRDLRELIRG